MRQTFCPTRDLALARGVIDREESAIREFADCLRCVPRILGAQNARSGRPLNEHDLADLVQDTTVIILRKLKEYAGAAPLESWIYRICMLEFMNGLRRRRRAMPVAEPEALVLEDERRTAELRQLEGREEIYRALERLGGVEAEAVAAKHLEGLTFAEMAERMGQPANTLKTRYYRGLERLERLLREAEQ